MHFSGCRTQLLSSTMIISGSHSPIIMQQSLSLESQQGSAVQVERVWMVWHLFYLQSGNSLTGDIGYVTVTCPSFPFRLSGWMLRHWVGPRGSCCCCWTCLCAAQLNIERKQFIVTISLKAHCICIRYLYTNMKFTWFFLYISCI